ncbi:MAG TPA: protein kinase [Gaiellaceae bacterium]|nr:protein kinase [Gaiellaceae bacterium]
MRRERRPSKAVLAGRYELLEQVGEGGVGVVWRAHDTRLGRDVAVKLLRPSVAGEPEQRRRFEREARTLAALANDHIVRIFDYVGAGEQAFLVMEYVDGGNLAQATRGRLPLSFSEAARYAAPVAQALAYAHGRGVVHRDLAPANILIERDTGRVLTGDFGLARIARSSSPLTLTGVLIGTPEFWSPEQAMGRGTDTPCDIYALGCILFLLLSGRLPFEDDDRLALGLRRAHENAPSLRSAAPNASARVISLVDSLLERDPTARPDAASVAIALARLDVGGDALPSVRDTPDVPSLAPTLALPSERTTVAVPKPAPPPAGPRRRRLAPAFAVAAAAAVAMLLFSGERGAAGPPAPNVVALPAKVARSQIVHLVPGAAVSTTAAYSTRIAAGRVISQRPRASERLRTDARVQLVISKGTPFARVPAIAAGTPAPAVKSMLARHGFHGRYRFTPSWTVRKGALIELRPAPATRVRRPATVKIVVASGYPRAVVPDVQDHDVAAAQAQLAAKHLRVRIVYRLTSDAPNVVLRQIPAAGATVYSGTRVRLTVSRTLRWVTVLARSGTEAFVSDAFTVPRHWRIRYRLGPGSFGPALAQVRWAHESDLFADGGFVADSPGGLRTYPVGDGAGTYRLAVSPYAGTRWYVAVEALE